MPLPKTVDTDTLAVALSIDDRSVRRLVKKGVLKRGPLGFNLIATIADYVAHREGIAAAAAGAGDYGRARTDVARERAAKMKLEREELEGGLVPCAETTASWSQIIVLIRTRMLTIPSKLALRLSLAKAPAECKVLLDTEIREALDDVANVEIVSTEEERRNVEATPN